MQQTGFEILPTPLLSQRIPKSFRNPAIAKKENTSQGQRDADARKNPLLIFTFRLGAQQIHRSSSNTQSTGKLSGDADPPMPCRKKKSKKIAVNQIRPADKNRSGIKHRTPLKIIQKSRSKKSI
ncbi:hypothetical protein TcG_09187 [Trypanosoma cruzi]|nr:hypothetical protein TcG_09187 [Trypanosoma cruzi]